mmetsp:Transcript_13948/g.28573  ORF Transcript_13948/g.28573 Transcript_13948/m.28573 type:complete len:87 (-) Transcript_13948:569-829(-)
MGPSCSPPGRPNRHSRRIKGVKVRSGRTLSRYCAIYTSSQTTQPNRKVSTIECYQVDLEHHKDSSIQSADDVLKTFVSQNFPSGTR